jgi:hypothetical protein
VAADVASSAGDKHSWQSRAITAEYAIISHLPIADLIGALGTCWTVLSSVSSRTRENTWLDPFTRRTRRVG